MNRISTFSIIFVMLAYSLCWPTIKEKRLNSSNSSSPATDVILLYCSSCYADFDDDYITNVSFNTINNTTVSEGAPCAYGDYTNLSTDVIMNQTYTLSVTFFSEGIWTEHVRAWFDWNQNEVFEGSESYYLGSGIDATLTTNITIPIYATFGSTRFRIIEQWNTDPGAGGACDPHGTSFGETEDYKINVLGGPDPGFLTGTVTDYQMNPINGAVVAVSFFTDTVGFDGIYFFELYPTMYSATATAEYHDSVTIDSIVINPNDTTIQDFILPTPLINADTSAIQLQVEVGETLTVQRNVSNVGDGELEFHIETITTPAVLSTRQKSNLGERIEHVSDPSGHSDVAPFTYRGGNLLVINDFQDSVFALDLAFLNDTQLLGIEFDGTYFWITGGNSGTDPNILYKLDAQGNFVAQFNQTGTAIWGWRDLAFDGQFLYASDDGIIDQIDPLTGDITGVTINGPENPNRALAYNPATDHFFTANWGSAIYEFDRSGTLFNIWGNSKSIYGMAYDDISDDGPWLWIFSQDGSPLMEISQFDPSTGTYTGLGWQCALPTGFSDGMAGGACLTTDWDSPIAALFLLGQGDPNDFIYGYEIAPFSRWLIVDPLSGVLQPAENINLDITIDFTGGDIIPNSIYTADIYIFNNTPETPVIPVIITSGDLLYDSVIKGIVSDTADVPIHGVFVSAGGTERADTTDTLGQYTLDSLIAGNFDITFSHPDYRDTTITDVFVAASDTTDLNIEMLFQERCIYVTGDVNASGDYNTLDISFGVGYFKGGDSPLCEPCEQCSNWYYCGDVNASSLYNGLDITYGVSYIKGNIDIIYPCPACPPIN